MKLVFIASGQSFHACRWANTLVHKGYDIHFISTVPFKRVLDSKINKYELKSLLGFSKYILNVRQVRVIIDKIKPDIIHAHYASGNGLLASLSLIGLNYPLVTSLYGSEVYDFPHKSLLHKKILKWIVSSSNQVLSTSEAMADEFLKLFPSFNRPIITPFGVDTKLFKPACVRINDGVLEIGLVKKLEHKYGVDILIKAFSIFIKESKQRAKLTIVGGGPDEAELKKLVCDLSIQDYVNFYGWVDNSDIPNFLNSLDIFVVPSRRESFGVAAVEAMACGLPTIVSNVGGLPEVVIHGESGLIFEKEDVDELVYLLNIVSQDQDLRKNMALKARDRVLDYYDWQCSVEIMERTYQSLC
ncbi:glycosyltransferase [Vibrio chagasii]|uniref:glycosyltransferase n=1 Tax=Vibrio chagasii TaxID=170679 RepID=UPI0037370650